MFEDESICVVDKPAGMVVNKSQTTAEITVQEWHAPKLKNQNSNIKTGEFYEKGGVVHRLDKETSGVMVLAKTPEIYEKLKKQFMERKTVKRYRALVNGIMDKESGIIAVPVERHPKVKKKLVKSFMWWLSSSNSSKMFSAHFLVAGFNVENCFFTFSISLLSKFLFERGSHSLLPPNDAD